MSLLTMCQDAMREVKAPVATAIVTATANQDAMIMLRLAKKEVFSLSRRALWNFLRKEHTFTTVAADSQTASIPADFSCFVDETIFDRTARRPLDGPMTPQEWAEYKAGLIVPFTPSFMRRGTTLLMAPTPAAGWTIGFEYISTNIVGTAPGASPTKATFTADGDGTPWPEEILTQGLIWRWRKQKGMTYEDERLDYERMVTDEIMRDGGKRRIQLGYKRGSPIGRRGRAGIQDYSTIPG